MHMQSFNSLSDLNDFLTSKGLPPITEEAVQEAAETQFGEDITQDTIRVAFPGNGERESVTPNENNVHDAAVAFSLDQISMLIKQRDHYHKMFEEELSLHNECHENFDLQLHEMRIYGHMESNAAGLFNKPYEMLSPSQQVAIRHQAETTIARLDQIRAESQG